MYDIRVTQVKNGWIVNVMIMSINQLMMVAPSIEEQIEMNKRILERDDVMENINKKEQDERMKKVGPHVFLNY